MKEIEVIKAKTLDGLIFGVVKTGDIYESILFWGPGLDLHSTYDAESMEILQNRFFKESRFLLDHDHTLSEGIPTGFMVINYNEPIDSTVVKIDLNEPTPVLSKVSDYMYSIKNHVMAVIGSEYNISRGVYHTFIEDKDKRTKYVSYGRLFNKDPNIINDLVVRTINKSDPLTCVFTKSPLDRSILAYSYRENFQWKTYVHLPKIYNIPKTLSVIRQELNKRCKVVPKVYYDYDLQKIVYDYTGCKYFKYVHQSAKMFKNGHYRTTVGIRADIELTLQAVKNKSSLVKPVDNNRSVFKKYSKAFIISFVIVTSVLTAIHFLKGVI